MKSPKELLQQRKYNRWIEWLVGWWDYRNEKGILSADGDYLEGYHDSAMGKTVPDFLTKEEQCSFARILSQDIKLHNHLTKRIDKL